MFTNPTKALKLILLALLLSCGAKENKRSEPDYGKLSSLREHYLVKVKSHQGEAGFIDSERCDSLLWSSLAAYGGAEVDLDAAENTPGEWFRRPISLPECWSNGESRSTISRDMLLGLMWSSQGNLSRLSALWQYGKDHNWVMGNGRFGGADTLMPPAYIALLADLILAAGGTGNGVLLASTYRNSVDANCEAYVCHVNVLRHYLRHKAKGRRLDVDGLAKISDRYPQNALFAWVAGRKKKAVDLLTKQYGTELPPFCEVWPMQENGGADNWKRCEDGQDSGGGFLFVSKLILEER